MAWPSLSPNLIPTCFFLMRTAEGALSRGLAGLLRISLQDFRQV
jgi:hypothetical protein